MWVDTSGGSCTRQSTAGSYVDGAACGSFDAAYDAAQPGDTIVIKGGNYGAQAITGEKGSTTPITIRSAPGETVAVDTGSTATSNWDVHTSYVTIIGPMTVRHSMDVDVSAGNPNG